LSGSTRQEQEVQPQQEKIAPNSQNRKIHKHTASSFELRAIPPFRLDLTAWALRRRPENEVDLWDGTTYRRVVLIHGRPAEISVSQNGACETPRVRVSVTCGRLGADTRAEVTALLTRMFGLRVNLNPFYQMAARDPKLRELAEKYRGLKPVRFPTVFETLANAFACQQFTLSAGLQLLNRLTKKGTVALKTEAGMVFGFPEPSDLLRISPRTFRKLGFSHQKTRAFRDLSRGILAGRFDFQALKNFSNDDAINLLLGLRGVGRWTAEYVLLRGLGRLDVFPGDDVGARNRLAKWLHRSRPLDYTSVRRALRGWQPYAGFIYFHMLMESLTATGKITVE
jgi:DNA-3-methyladenine glycosylase II